MTETLSIKREEFMELWKALIPDFCPSEYQFNLWLTMYPQESLEWAIKETAVKFHRKHGKMDDDYLVKFTSSIMKKHIVAPKTQEVAQ